MAAQPFITERQHALLKHLACAGEKGAATASFLRLTISTCLNRGLITRVVPQETSVVPSEERHSITPYGLEVIAFYAAIGTRPRGFGAMKRDRVREIARAGGLAAHAQGKAHEFKAGDPLTIAAGKKGSASRLANLAKKEIP